MARRVLLTIPAEAAGLRLDQALARLVPELSRTRAKSLLTLGAVFLDRHRVKVAGRIVREGQSLQVTLSERQADPVEAESQPPLGIVHATSAFVVVDKPPGMFSAPTTESDRGDVIDRLREHFRRLEESTELFVVHRLDRPTSGLMVVARTRAAAAELSRQLREHAMRRDYLVLAADPAGRWVEHASAQGEWTADAPLDERAAVTHFRLLQECRGLLSLHARLETGRMHQVRRHVLGAGCALAGDSKYGRQISRALFQQNAPPGLNRAPRLGLHATRLCFDDPSDGGPLEFSSPLPQDLQDFWERWCKEPARLERPGVARSD